MRRASPGAEHWRVSQGRIEAIKMPPKTTDTARHDGTIIGRRFTAHVTENRVTLVISQTEEVWSLLLGLLLPVVCVS
jgi:hypothetical protein